MGKKFYRINQFIRAGQVRVIGEDGKQVGILSTKEAWEIAQAQGLDLVEIAPTANPPVTRIIDYKKFLYQEEKKEREAKKKNKGGDLKEIRLTPFIAQGDLEVRIKRAEEFIREGNKVRAVVRFTGRQLGKKGFGYEVLTKTVAALSTLAVVEGEPKWIGRSLVTTLTPSKNQGTEKQNESNAKTENQEISHQKV